MNTNADKTTDNQSNAVAQGMAVQQTAEHEGTLQLEDNRPQAIAQRKIQDAANNSPQVAQLKAIQAMANNSPQVNQLKSVQKMANGNVQVKQPRNLQALADNNTGKSEKQSEPLQKKEAVTAQLVDTGTATAAVTEAYTGAGKAVFDAWAGITPVERGTRLGAIANAQLTAIGVPAVAINAAEDLGANNGEFHFATWTLKISKNKVESADITKEIMASVINTVTHEARHAEQWFRAARWRAGLGRSKEQITADMGIPLAITTAAVAAQLQAPGPFDILITPAEQLELQKKEVEEAEAWYQSIYGTGAAHRNATFAKLNAADAAIKTAREAYKVKNDELKAAKLEFDNANWWHSMATSAADEAVRKAAAEKVAKKISDIEFELFGFTRDAKGLMKKKAEAHAQYKALPEEADAHTVGDAVEARYKARY